MEDLERGVLDGWESSVASRTSSNTSLSMPGVDALEVRGGFVPCHPSKAQRQLATGRRDEDLPWPSKRPALEARDRSFSPGASSSQQQDLWSCSQSWSSWSRGSPPPPVGVLTELCLGLHGGDDGALTDYSRKGGSPKPSSEEWGQRLYSREASPVRHGEASSLRHGEASSLRHGEASSLRHGAVSYTHLRAHETA